jgi:hypothetical protein
MSSPDGIRGDTSTPSNSRISAPQFPVRSPSENGLVPSAGGLRTASIAAGPNPKRLRAFIQNQANANHLHVKLGPGCTTTDYHFTLAVAASAGNGTGGQHFIENYGGEISVASAGAVSYSFYETSR